MKSKLLILFLILTSWTARADYDVYQLYEMILGADKIVSGEIVQTDSLTFTLRVDKDFTGNEKVIKIHKHENWPCAWRWAQYEVGQRLLLFLAEINGELYQMGPGNESELPLLDNHVFVHSISFNKLPYKLDSIGKTKKIIFPERHNLYGKDFYGCRIEMEKLAYAITSLRECYSILPTKYGRIETVELVCDNQEINQKARNNEIINWAVEVLRQKTADITNTE